jgi:hypothetical protein
MATSYDDGPVRVTWTVTDDDAMARTFRIKDDAGAYVADPEVDGWVFFGQVRDERGGTVVGEITFTFDGAYVTQTLPDTGDGKFWWEKEVTPPAGKKRTTEAGPLVVLVDSAVDGGS